MSFGTFLGNKPRWNFYQNAQLSIHENAFEKIVCEMAAILSTGDELTHCGPMRMGSRNDFKWPSNRCQTITRNNYGQVNTYEQT